MTRPAPRSGPVPLLVLACLLLAACGGDGALTGDAVPNSPPDTRVTSSPPVLKQTSFTVEFFWTGSDPDGEVAAYEWRISSNGRDGVVDVEDTLTANLPWHRTIATDSTFVVSADIDSFRIDVDDPRQDPSSYRFWQTHTFFIRSIDDQGLADPTPANVSFTATTLAPTVTIETPRYIPFNSCVSGSKVLTFGWEGDDPDNPEGEPAFVRYLLLPVGSSEDPCLTRAGYEASAPIRREDPGWSEWIRYDAPQDSGRTVTLPRQSVGDTFLFAVQARDVAGAVSPLFEWGANVRHVRIGRDKFPLLLVSERFLGTESFVSTNGLESFELVQGQDLEFDWSADASNYAGVIEAYRYGWNLTDPDDPNDPGWAVAWGNGPAWRRAPARSFAQGTPNFVVQCRDNSGTITRAFYQFRVIQIAQRQDQRDLLLLDDWRLEDTPQTQALELEWDLRWENLLLGQVKGFQRTDVIDAQDEPERVAFETVNQYKSVIWFTNASDLSFFHTRLAPESTDAPRYNWLEVYQARVGNLLVVGPSSMYNSLERRSPPLWQPIVLNTPQSGRLGLGTFESADGRTQNTGTTRWPYSAWCLELVDTVRPAIEIIFNEIPGRPVRSLACDGLYRAEVAPAFLARYADATGEVTDLLPSPPRERNDSLYKFQTEEFYNRNPTNRPVTVVPRDCQVPMFLHRARRDEGQVVNPVTSCPPGGLPSSRLDGAPIAVVSRVYRDSKQLVGSDDILWGFHPFGFQTAGIAQSLRWILEARWELPLN